MRVFVTGASGFIGQAVVRELVTNGHAVLGLARTDEKAAQLAKLGAEVQHGDLEDHASLTKGVMACDATIHLAFVHDFSRYAQANDIDRAAIGAMFDVLAGTNKPFIGTSGTAMATPGRTATEDDPPNKDGHALRAKAEELVVASASRGIRTAVVRLSPTVHGEGDKGFVPMLVDIARKKGIAGYIGDGANRWSAVHRTDAARLYRLAVEKGAAGVRFHGVAEEGIAMKTIAEAIGRGLGVPTKSIAPADAQAHFDFLARFAGVDCPTSSAITQKTLGWTPTGPDLASDIEKHYVRA